jgi:hypothetical protein
MEEMSANVVVTHEGHLVFEILGMGNKGEKMAILKLKEIKISRKNNSLLLKDCRKGVIGYFVSTNTVLGSLEF